MAALQALLGSETEDFPLHGLRRMLELHPACAEGPPEQAGAAAAQEESGPERAARLLEERHLASLQRMDQLLDALQRAEGQLSGELRGERQAAAEREQRAEAAELQRAQQECAISALRADVDDAERELGDAEHRYRRLRARLAESSAARLRTAHASAMDDLLEIAEDPIELLHEMAGRENTLCSLEDRQLEGDEVLRKHLLELSRLRLEHDRAPTPPLQGGAVDARAEAEGEIQSSQRVVRSLSFTMDELRDRKLRAEDSRLQRQQELDALLRREAELREQQAQLRVSLGEAQAALAECVRCHDGGQLSEREVQIKLEEAMMLLKAIAISFATDTDFIGDVCAHCSSAPAAAEASPPPLFAPPAPGPAETGFEAAFGLVRSYIVSVHGEQGSGQRWVLRQRGARPDEDHVEALLGALKQLVICYDAMPPAVRRALPNALEVARNSGPLCALARDLMQAALGEGGALPREQPQQPAAGAQRARGRPSRERRD
eukprot:TRINITY_DN16011_c0_g1_i1.p1 TRINITY_DN16011_c0_g1~~TRINITY_DN16011_c0_g1_i1.p1  ORF type:complete len:523 (+),score=181.04 TRINITY_DN16011_c0_g1_i1:97-1569(+)